MSEPEEKPPVVYGHNKETNTWAFGAVGRMWIASINWTNCHHRAYDFVSKYDGRVDMGLLRREIGLISELTVASVRLHPMRWALIGEMPDSHVRMADMKGGSNDPTPWSFRKVIPPVRFSSVWYHSDGGWKTVVTAMSDPFTPSQREWLEANIVVPLDNQFTVTHRAAYLSEAKRLRCSQLKDGLMMDAFKTMAHYRNLAEDIEANYDSLVINSPQPA